MSHIGDGYHRVQISVFREHHGKVIPALIEQSVQFHESKIGGACIEPLLCADLERGRK